MTSAPLVGAYGLEYRVGGRVILREISLEIGAGEVIALLGPNGAGKTTLMKVLAGVIPPGTRGLQGIVQYRGERIGSLASSSRARQVAYVGADLSAEFPVTVEQAVMMGSICHGGGLITTPVARDRDEVQWALEECQCSGFRRRLLHTLSGGERQLVGLARALAQGSKVLLLDEALSRMDLHHQARCGSLLRRLAREGRSIVVVAHDWNLATEWAGRGVLLRSGTRWKDGPIAEVLAQESVSGLYPGAGLITGSSPTTGSPKVYFGSAGQK